MTNFENYDSNMDAKVRALQQLHNEKTKALMRSIDQLRRQVKTLKSQNKESNRTRLIKQLQSEKRDIELKVDVLKKQLCQESGKSPAQVDDFVIAKTLGGPKRFRPKTREELASELRTLKRDLDKAKRSISKSKSSTFFAPSKERAAPPPAATATVAASTTNGAPSLREAELLDQVYELTREIVGLRRTADAHADTVRSLRSDAREHRVIAGKYKRVAEKYQRSKEKIRKLQEDGIESARRHEQLVADVQRAAAEKDLIEKELHRQTEEFESQKVKHAQAISEFRLREQGHLDDVDALRRDVAALKQRTFDKSRSAEEEETSLRELMIELGQERAQRKAAEDKARRLESSRSDDPSAEVRAMEAEMGDLRARNDDLTARNSDLKARNSDLKARNSDLKTRNNDLKARNNDLKARNDDLRVRNDDLALRKASAEADVQDMKRSIPKRTTPKVATYKAPAPTMNSVQVATSPKLMFSSKDDFALMHENDKIRAELGDALAYGKGIEMRLRAISDERDEALSEYAKVVKSLSAMQERFDVQLSKLRLEFLKLNRKGKLDAKTVDRGIMRSLRESAKTMMKHSNERIHALESQAEFSQVRDSVFRACTEKMRFHAETLDARLRSLGFDPPPMPDLQKLAREVTLAGASSNSGSSTSSSSSPIPRLDGDGGNDFEDDEAYESKVADDLPEDDDEDDDDDDDVRGVFGDQYDFYDDSVEDAYEDDESQIHNAIMSRKYYVP